MPSYYAACTLGLEQVLADELASIGADHIEVRKGACSFFGDPIVAYRACLWLRSAIRVQQEMARGRVTNKAELYDLTKSVDWSRSIAHDGTLAVDGAIRDSFANDTRFPVLVVKDAICDQFRKAQGVRPDVEKDRPDLPVKLVMLGDEAILYRDLGGAPLHKRGYREIQHKSPLNEALAAGLLLLADIDPMAPLVDPMCGSGTLLAEAAWIAMDRAPGLGRSFAFERWLDTDQTAWQSAFDEAEQRAAAGQDHCPPLAGNDRHPGAIAIAEQSLRAAGLQDKVTLRHGDAGDWQPPFVPKAVVTNPPYGERLQPNIDELIDTWGALGEFLHRQCGGAIAHVLCGNPDLPRQLGLRSSRKHPVLNGPIDCRWLRYEINAHDGDGHRSSVQDSNTNEGEDPANDSSSDDSRANDSSAYDGSDEAGER